MRSANATSLLCSPPQDPIFCLFSLGWSLDGHAQAAVRLQNGAQEDDAGHEDGQPDDQDDGRRQARRADHRRRQHGERQLGLCLQSDDCLQGKVLSP